MKKKYYLFSMFILLVFMLTSGFIFESIFPSSSTPVLILKYLTGGVNTPAENPTPSPNAMVSESFDGLTLPTGWTNTILNGTYSWGFVASGSFPTCSPHSGAGMATFQSFNASTGYAAALITPSFSLTSGQGVVNFWMMRDPGYSGNYDSVQVYVNTTASYTGATWIGGVWRYSAVQNWYYFSYSIPVGFNGPTNYVIFKGLSAYGNNMYMDDVSYGVPSPMAYVSSTTTQNTGNVVSNSTNNQIIGIQVVTTGLSNPFNVTQFKLTTTGSSNPATDIRNGKVFYTGNSPSFNTSLQFGTTVTNPNGVFYIAGTQALTEGTNYFWVSYDIPAGATGGNLVDATCDSIFASGTMGNVAPSPQAPAGARQIVGPMAGTYTVGTGMNYPNITSAINDLNIRGVSAAVTFLVKPGNYGIDAGLEIDSSLTFLAYLGASATNTVTIKKKSDETGEVWVQRWGTALTNDYIIGISGGDYYTFDSINVRQKDTLTYNMADYGYYLWNIATNNGATYNTIRNCQIYLKSTNTSTIGIYNNYVTVPTTIAGTNSFNKFHNNSIYNSRQGFRIYGYSSAVPYYTYDQSNEVIGNTITNFGYTASTTYGIYAIYQNNLKIGNNTLLAFPGLSTTAYPIYTGTANYSNVDIYGNTITIPGMTGGPLYCIYNTMGGTPLGNRVNINNNRFVNSYFGSAYTGTVYGVYFSATPDTVNITGNVFANDSIPGSGSFYGVYQASSPNNVNISGDSVYNIYKVGMGSIYGIYNASSAAAGFEKIYNNYIYNLNSIGTGLITGIYSSVNAVTTSYIYNNTIGAYTSGGFLYGLVFSGSDKRYVYNNKIFNLKTTGTSHSSCGINPAGGTNYYIYNNSISGLKSSSNTSSYITPIGIYITGGIFAGVYYNSIYLADTLTGTTTNSAGVYHASTATLDLRNNNIVNITKNPGTTFNNKTVGLRFLAPTYLAYLSPNSNNNNIYCGLTSDTTRAIFFDGVNRDLTLQAFKNRVTPREQSSISEMPSFIDAYGNDLHLNAGVSLLEKGALPILNPIAVANDFDGNARNTSFPDIGFDEISGTAATDVIQPTIIYDLLGNGTTSNRTLSNVTVFDPSGFNTTIRPRVYYKKSINANTFNDNTSATDGWKYAIANGAGSSPFDFTIDYTKIFGGSVIAGDIIQYFVVAQDLAGTPNVGINAGAFNTIPASVALLAANFPITSTINQYSITGTGIGTSVTVGATGTYPTLTGVGGFFAAVNSGVFTGNVTVTINSDINEPGTNQLNQWAEQLAPAYSLTIQSDGTLRTIYGYVSNYMIRFNGVQNVTIDGGAGKYLKFSNRNTTFGTIQFYNACMNNTIKNCIIEGMSTSTAYGTIAFTTGNTALLQGNSNNTITNNLIRDRSDSLGIPAIGIYSQGSSSTVLNANNNIYNNEICNFGYYGIYISSTGNGDGWKISKNSFYYASTLPQFATTWSAVYDIPGIYGSGHTIDSNYIGGTQAMAGGQYIYSNGFFNGIYTSLGYNSLSNIRSNTINNFRSRILTASSTTYYAIYGSTGYMNIANNTIGSSDTSKRIETNQIMRCISAIANTTYGNYTLNINNNYINNLWTRQDSLWTITTSYVRTGISYGGLGNVNCIGNSVMNILTWQSPVATSYNQFNIGILPNGNGINIIKNNYVYNIANLATAAPIGVGRIICYGMQPNALGNGSIVSENKIHRVYSSTTSGINDLTVGLYNAGPAAGATNSFINNQVTMLDNTGDQSAIFGIWDVATVGGLVNYFYNSILIGGTTTAGTYHDYGYYKQSTTLSVNLKDNLFYNQRAGGIGNHYSIGVVSLGLMKNSKIPEPPPALTEGEAGLKVQNTGRMGTSPLFTSDYNLLVAPTSTYIADWYGTGSTFAAWQTASGGDMSSVWDTVLNAPSATLFRSVSTGNLNIDTAQVVSVLVGKRGNGITGITNDYNGWPRNASGYVCIGSHEFNYTKPVAPVLVSPANGAINVPAPVLLVWNKSIFASGYRVQISIDSLFGSFTINTNVADSTYSFTSPSGSTKYYWRVNPTYTQYGNGMFSSVWNFTTAVIGSPLTGIKFIPGDYPSIPLAVTDLNTWGVGTGGVTFKVAAGKVDTAANLVINTTGTSTKPIIFEKNGAGANPVVVAGVGNGTMDGIIKLNGVDYITFNGIDLMENPANTTTQAQMEWGYALLKIDGTNGSQVNTIKNCVITLNKTNTSTVGIYTANHTIASTTSLTVTAFSGTNSQNMLNGNTIRNCYIGINVAGFNDATYAYYDHYNQIGNETGNTIRDFGGGTNTTYGIYTIYQDSMAVSNNDIGGGTGSTGTSYGIFISTCYNSSYIVYNNTVSDTTATLTSTTYGIAMNNAGHNGVDNSIIIKRNTVKGMTNTAAATSASLYGYYIYYVTPGINLTVDSNKFINTRWGNSTGTFTGTIYGIYTRPYTLTPVTGSVMTYTNNYVGGNSRIQSAPGTGTTYGMYLYYGLETNNYNNNTVENDTVTSTSTGYGMYLYHYYTTNSTFNNNIVRNIYKPAGSSGTYYGIYVSSGSSSTGTYNFYNNAVNNINSYDAGTIYGCYISGSSLTKNMYGNTFYNLRTTAAGAVYGLYQTSGEGINIYKNRIYNLRTGTGTGYGIYIASGTTNTMYNNFISDIRSDSSITSPGLYGMYISGGTTSYVYYNSIYLNSVSTGATFGTSVLYASTTPTLYLRNNIFVNTSTPGITSGNVVAYQRSSATLATYADSSNNNCFYSGIPSASRLIFYDGANSDSTIAQFKTRVAPRDANSFTEKPPFVNDTIAPYNLHLKTTIPTMCESGAKPIYLPFAITDDFDGNTRNTTTPDVGADEGTFTPVAVGLPLNLKAYLEGFWNGTSQVTDTVQIYLANSTTPYAFVDTAKLVLSSTGTANPTFTRASGGNYYIVVKHRNHLETWSKLPQLFTPGVPVNYDFTTAANKAFGDNMKQVGAVWVFYGGDPNQDGEISAIDIPIFISQFGTQGYLSCDFDGDNDVTGLDVAIISSNFGLTKAVPTVDERERKRIENNGNNKSNKKINTKQNDMNNNQNNKKSEKVKK